MGDKTGIFHNRGREIRCLQEESISLGSKRNVMREKRAREQYKEEKILISVKRNNVPLFFKCSGIQALGSEGFTVKRQGALSRVVGLAFREQCEPGAVLDAQLAACKGILAPRSSPRCQNTGVL